MRLKMTQKERFSLLLLDPSEIFFEDYSVDFLCNSKTEEKISGSLKVCSKSLVFEPKDIKLPLIKLRYSDCYKISNTIEIRKQIAFSNNKNKLLTISSTQSIEMLKNNIIAPYESKRIEQIFIIKFHYANVNEILPFCQQLHRASTLNTSEQNNMIALIAYSFHSRKYFNNLWLADIYEKKINECKVDEIRPLVNIPGRLLLTNAFIYFQSFINISPYPVVKIKLSLIRGFLKKRFLLRHTGLEIKWDDNKNLYISFKNSAEREQFCSLTEKQVDFNLPKVKQESMTLKWQNRLITNYEYLMYLNSMADRSFEDLTQYPVFPWILTDYTSTSIDVKDKNIYRDLTKPVGALNPKRLAKLIERSNEMDEPKYLYGSHYSNPGFVLFYLVRKVPHLMLCFQNGKFDCPDRMFNNIGDTYNNCLSNMSDFKELIPEFYDPLNKGDFLRNLKKINLGCRSDGSIVNDVILPPWADHSTEKFISILRNALESEYVSENIHHWIDLIFGYKQRGKEAKKALNVFHHNCYEGNVDLDTIKDMSERHALENQIYEFGQVSKQLFTTPHVSRNKFIKNDIEIPVKIQSLPGSINSFEIELKGSYSAHKEGITSIYNDNDQIWSTGKDGILKCFSIAEKRQTRSISIGKLALSSCEKVSDSNIIAVGSWNNYIYLYESTFGRISNEVQAHFDSVSCLSLVEDLNLLISGSWDCSVKIWRISNLEVLGSFSLDDSIVCLTNAKFENVLQIAIGTENGVVFKLDLPLADLQTECSCAEPIKFIQHSSKIKCVKFNKNLTKLASCSYNGLITVNDIKEGMELFSTNINNYPTCLCWFGDLDVLIVVDENGSLSVWDLYRGELIHDAKIFNGSLSCVNYSKSNDILITGGQECNECIIKYWSIRTKNI